MSTTVPSTTSASLLEQLPVAPNLDEVEVTTSASALPAQNSTSATAAAIVTELSNQVSQLVFSATTEAFQPDHPDQTEDDDDERRKLLIGVICLVVALVIVLVAIGFFFYKVHFFQLTSLVSYVVGYPLIISD